MKVKAVEKTIVLSSCSTFVFFVAGRGVEFSLTPLEAWVLNAIVVPARLAMEQKDTGFIFFECVNTAGYDTIKIFYVLEGKGK